jgi:hypothetical protein
LPALVDRNHSRPLLHPFAELTDSESLSLDK